MAKKKSTKSSSEILQDKLSKYEKQIKNGQTSSGYNSSEFGERAHARYENQQIQTGRASLKGAFQQDGYYMPAIQRGISNRDEEIMNVAERLAKNSTNGKWHETATVRSGRIDNGKVGFSFTVPKTAEERASWKTPVIGEKPEETEEDKIRMMMQDAAMDPLNRGQQMATNMIYSDYANKKYKEMLASDTEMARLKKKNQAAYDEVNNALAYKRNMYSDLNIQAGIDPDTENQSEETIISNILKRHGISDEEARLYAKNWNRYEKYDELGYAYDTSHANSKPLTIDEQTKMSNDAFSKIDPEQKAVIDRLFEESNKYHDRTEKGANASDQRAVNLAKNKLIENGMNEEKASWYAENWEYMNQLINGAPYRTDRQTALDKYGDEAYSLALDVLNERGNKNPFNLLNKDFKDKASADYANLQAIAGEDTEKILQYVQEMEDEKATYNRDLRFQEILGEHPRLAKVAGTAIADAGEVVSGLAAMGEFTRATGYADKNAPVNVYSDRYALKNLDRGIQSAVTERIGLDSMIAGDSEFTTKTKQALYGMTNSTITSGLSIAIGGALGKVLGTSSAAASQIAEAVTLTEFSANAFASTYQEQIEKGTDHKDALRTATISAVAEAFFERYSLESLQGMYFARKAGETGFKRTIAQLLSQGLVEGSEEVFTDLANYYGDYLINGGFSEYSQLVRENEMNGMSHEEAVMDATFKIAKKIGVSGIGGVFSGLLLGTGTTVASAVNVSNAAHTIVDTPELSAVKDNILETARQQAENTTARKVVDELDASNKEATAGDIAKIIESEISIGQEEQSIDEFVAEIVNAVEGLSEEEKTDAVDTIMNSLNTESENVTEEQEQKLTETLDKDEKLSDAYAKAVTGEYAPASNTVNTAMSAAKAVQESNKAKAKLESSYESGKNKGLAAVTVNGEDSTVTKVLKNGKVEVYTKGKGFQTVSIGNTLYKSSNASYVHNFLSHDSMISEQNATALASQYKSSIPAQTWTEGVRTAFLEGAANTGSIESLLDNGKNAFVAVVPQETLATAYALGKEYANSQTKAEVKAPAKRLKQGRLLNTSGQLEGKVDERTQMLAETLAMITGNNIVFKDAVADGSEGTYNSITRTIEISLEHLDAAGHLTATDIIRVLGHEALGEYFEKVNAEGYDKVRKATIDLMEKVEGSSKTNATIKRIMEVYQKSVESGKTLEEASGELANNLIAEIMFSEDGANDIADIINEFAPEERQSIFQSFINFINDLINDIKSLFEGRNTGISAMAEIEDLQRIRDIFKEEYVKGIRSDMENSQTAAESVNSMTESTGIEVDPETATAVSHSMDTRLIETYKKLGYKTYEEALQDVSEKIALSLGAKKPLKSGKGQAEWDAEVEKAKQWVEAENSLANIILSTEENRKYLTYESDSRYKAIKKNSDYPQGTFDVNNLCRKRDLFTKIFDAMQKDMPNKLYTANDIASIRQAMWESNLEVACALCYVEDRRQQVGEIADTFIGMYKKALNSEDHVIKKLNYKKEEKPLVASKDQIKKYGLKGRAGDTIIAVNGNNKGKPVPATFFYAEDSYIPNQYDLTTYRGFKELTENHPSIAYAFENYNNSRGMQAARLVEGRAEYDREILRWTPNQVKAKNRKGGLRMYSFSDFEAIHLIDTVQVIMDAAAKGVHIQAYTKVPAFAKLVSKTGIKLNRSLIPATSKSSKAYAYINGKFVKVDATDEGIATVDGVDYLAFDCIEGIDVTSPDFIDESGNNNIGNIIIGINDKQIRLAMESPFIDYIIPFHTGQSDKVLEAKHIGSWNNYKNFQEDKKLKGASDSEKGINIYNDLFYNKRYKDRIVDKHTFVECFLEECERRHLEPRFSQFATELKDGKAQIAEGYYKFLVDFKTFDAEGNIHLQENVRPEFDLEFMNEILMKDKERAKKLDAPDELVDLIRNKMQEVGTDTSENISRSVDYNVDSLGKVLNKEQDNYFTDTQVRDESGNLLRMYHGTDQEFYEFDRNKIGRHGRFEGSGFNFTPSKARAMGYGAENVLDGYVNITNPLSAETKTMTVRELANLIAEIDPTGDDIIANYAYDTRDYGSKSFVTREAMTTAKAIYEYAENDVDIYSNLSASGGSDNLIDAFKKLGYDGLIHYNDDGSIKTAITFDSNQFKYANNTSPTSNPDIRYSIDYKIDEDAIEIFMDDNTVRRSLSSEELGIFNNLNQDFKKQGLNLTQADSHLIDLANELWQAELTYDSLSLMPSDTEAQEQTRQAAKKKVDSLLKEILDIKAGRKQLNTTEGIHNRQVSIVEEGMKSATKLNIEVDDKLVSKIAKNILKDNSSKFDRATLESNLKNVFAYIKDRGGKVSYEDLMAVMDEIARPVLEQATANTGEGFEDRQHIMDYLKGAKLKLNPEQMQEVKNVYGSYNTFRAQQGLMGVWSNSGTYIDEVWDEICDAAGGSLDIATVPQEQPTALLATLEALKGKEVGLLSGQSLDQAARDLSIDIFRQFFELQSGENIQANKTLRQAYTQTYLELRKTQAELQKAYANDTAKAKQLAMEDAAAVNRAETLQHLIDDVDNDLINAKESGDFYLSSELEEQKKKYQERIEKLKAENKAVREKLADVKLRNRNTRTQEMYNRRNKELKKRIQKNMDYLNSLLSNETEKKHVPVLMVNEVIEICKLVTPEQTNSKLLQQKLEKLSNMYRAYQTDGTFMQANTGGFNADNTSFIDYDKQLQEKIDKLGKLLNGRKYTQLLSPELQELLEITNAIKTTIRNANALIANQRIKDAREGSKLIMSELKDSNNLTKAFGRKIEPYMIQHLNSYREFRKLSGYKDDGVLMSLWNELSDAEMKEEQVLKEIDDIFNSVLDGKENQKNLKKLISFKKEDMVDIGVKDEDGNPVLVTRGMRLSLIMHTYNQSNLYHLLGDGIVIPNMKDYEKGDYTKAFDDHGTTYRLVEVGAFKKALEIEDKNARDMAIKALQDRAVAQLKTLESQLDPYEQEYLEAVKEMFWKYTGKKINETSVRLNGYAKAKVDKYFPIKVDPDFTGQDFAGLIQDATVESWGSLKSRVTSKKQIYLEDITEVILRQAKMTARYTGYAIAIRDMNMLMNISYYDENLLKHNVRKTLSQTWGKENVKYVKELMQDIQGGRNTTSHPILAKLRGNFAGATLNLNAVVAAKQASSYPTAAAVLGWGPILKAQKDIGKGFVKKEGLEKLEAINPLLWYRNQGNSTEELGDIRAKKGFGEKITSISLLNWIQFMDTGTVRTLEYAAKYYVDSMIADGAEGYKNITEGSVSYWNKVSEIFTKTVHETQPNYSVLERAAIQRDPDSLIKNLMMFKTQPLQNFGIMYDALGEVRAKSVALANDKEKSEKSKAELKAAKEKLARAISSQLVAAIVYSSIDVLLKNLLKNAWYKLKDDKDEDNDGDTGEIIDLKGKLARKILLEGTLSALSGGVIFGSEIYAFINAVITGGNYYGVEVASVETISTLATQMMNIKTYADKEADAKNTADERKYAYKKWMSVVKLVGSLSTMFNIPFNTIYGYVDGAYRYAKGFGEGKRLGEMGPYEYDETQRELMLQAFKTGNIDEYMRLWEETTSEKTGEKADLTSTIKDAYLKGEITEEQAVDWLIDYKDKINDEKEANLKIEEWEWKAEHPDESYDANAKTEDLQQYLGNKDWKSAKTEIEALQEKGISDDSIKKGIKNACFDEYQRLKKAKKSANYVNELAKLMAQAGLYKDVKSATTAIQNNWLTDEEKAKQEAEKAKKKKK